MILSVFFIVVVTARMPQIMVVGASEMTHYLMFMFITSSLVLIRYTAFICNIFYLFNI
jgi:hypothetical protein